MVGPLAKLAEVRGSEPDREGGGRNEGAGRKSGGASEHVLRISSDSTGLADWRATAGGEGGHGAAKPDGVIHRYVFYQDKL